MNWMNCVLFSARIRPACRVNNQESHYRPSRCADSRSPVTRMADALQYTSCVVAICLDARRLRKPFTKEVRTGELCDMATADRGDPAPCQFDQKRRPAAESDFLVTVFPVLSTHF